MSTAMQQKRGSQTDWDNNSSIVLAAGEIGLNLTTLQFKVGDGSTPWSGLSYWTTGGGGGGGSYQPLPSVQNFTTAPQTTWTITHSLGYNPNVTTVDTAYHQIEGDVVFVNSTTVTVTFSTAQTGYAYIS